MHGKGVGALLLCAALLAGCGGGERSNSNSVFTSTAAPESPSASTEGSLPEEVEDRLEQAKAKARQEREAQQREKSSSSQPPQTEHHDSGGGSSQFRAKGGDNSIVEYGKEASQGERDEAAESLHAFLDSLAARRWQAACSYVSLGLIAGLEQLPQLSKRETGIEGCPEILEALNGQASDSALEAGAQADVVSLRTEGDRAFLIYRGAGDRGYVMPMVREEGVWRVSSIAGTPAL